VTIDELAAREAVRDLVARYNGYGDSGRLDDLLGLFADDAVLVTEHAVCEGPTAIRAFFTSVTGPSPERIRHFTSTLRIDVDGPDHATARCYFEVLTAAGLDHWGRYRDDIVRIDDRWLFRRREVRVDGMAQDGWAAQRRRETGHDAP
jgi:uncharacterized protein (TIGR02246 family)